MTDLPPSRPSDALSLDDAVAAASSTAAAAAALVGTTERDDVDAARMVARAHALIRDTQALLESVRRRSGDSGWAVSPGAPSPDGRRPAPGPPTDLLDHLPADPTAQPVAPRPGQWRDGHPGTEIGAGGLGATAVWGDWQASASRAVVVRVAFANGRVVASESPLLGHGSATDDPDADPSRGAPPSSPGA
jgi:hypothetical protein